jgi:ankyrin repeat protein
MTMEMSCRQHRLSSYWLRCLLFIIALNARTAVSGGNAADHEHDDDSTRMMQFFQACQNGPLSSLQEILDQHPTWLQTHRTATGESCLHLASLTGYLPVMEWLLQSPLDSSSNPHRMDVNIRSMGDRSLRETPLSMAVKNANVKAAKLLLEAGADVNLDIDSTYIEIHNSDVDEAM